MTLKPALFAKEVLLFGLTMIVGLFVAFKYAAIQSAQPIIQAPSFSIIDLIWLALVIAFFVFMTRFSRVAKIVFWVFLVLIIFSGADVVFGLWTPSPWDVVASLILLALFFSWRNVLIHDIAIIMSLAGIGAILGISITPTLGVIVLLALSFYDIIAVYKTRHMVRLAQGMVKSGAIFGFIIPSQAKKFFAPHDQAREQIGDQFMILGSGDIGLPVIFAASLIRQSLSEAVIVAVFAVLGLLLTHLLFVNQKKRQAMAALPPIATMCLIGYIVALLLVK